MKLGKIISCIFFLNVKFSPFLLALCIISINFNFSFHFVFPSQSLWLFFFLSCSMFPKSTHETFSNKLYQTFKNNKRFIKPKLSRTDFTIAHYAGEVWSVLPSINILLELTALTFCFFFLPNNFISGSLSIRPVFGQKQGLRGSRASRFVECF